MKFEGHQNDLSTLGTQFEIPFSSKYLVILNRSSGYH